MPQSFFSVREVPKSPSHSVSSLTSSRTTHAMLHSIAYTGHCHCLLRVALLRFSSVFFGLTRSQNSLLASLQARIANRFVTRVPRGGLRFRRGPFRKSSFFERFRRRFASFEVPRAIIRRREAFSNVESRRKRSRSPVIEDSRDRSISNRARTTFSTTRSLFPVVLNTLPLSIVNRGPFSGNRRFSSKSPTFASRLHFRRRFFDAAKLFFRSRSSEIAFSLGFFADVIANNPRHVAFHRLYGSLPLSFACGSSPLLLRLFRSHSLSKLSSRFVASENSQSVRYSQAFTRSPIVLYPAKVSRTFFPPRLNVTDDGLIAPSSSLRRICHVDVLFSIAAILEFFDGDATISVRAVSSPILRQFPFSSELSSREAVAPIGTLYIPVSLIVHFSGVVLFFETFCFRKFPFSTLEESIAFGRLSLSEYFDIAVFRSRSLIRPFFRFHRHSTF